MGLRTVLRLGAVAAALGLGSGCGERPPSARADTAAAPAGSVVVDTVTVELPLSLPAQLYVEHDAIVAARSAGTVESVLVDLGARVERGQLLATLESAEQEIALAQAEQTYANRRRAVERARVMTAAGALTVADSERAELEFHQAELAVRKAQRDLELTRIAAPFAGMVTAREARPRRLVALGDTLFRVTATGPLLARVQVPEGPAVKVAIGAEAEVIGAGGEAARARVVRASPALDPASGTREVVLALSPGARLLSGANVTVRLGAERRRVLAVPRDAIAGEGYATVWENNRTVLRAVTLGADLGGGRVEVVSGLAAGERLVRSGP